jgi:hypothetical protein
MPGVRWPELDDAQRGAFLNIMAKSWATFAGACPIAGYIERVLQVRVDRLICRMAPELAHQLATAEQAGLFTVVTSGVGHDPPAGYDNGPSYKTRDDFGNLQVSLFEAEAPAGGWVVDGELLADLDVDEERGFVHAFRALRHIITGDKTDAVEVQQILAAQGIDAGWRPLIA